MRNVLLYEDPNTGGPIALVFPTYEARDAFEEAHPNLQAIGTAPVVGVREAAKDLKAAL